MFFTHKNIARPWYMTHIARGPPHIPRGPVEYEMGRVEYGVVRVEYEKNQTRQHPQDKTHP